MRGLLPFLMLACGGGWMSSLGAQTYYVDFDGGSDAASGAAPNSPFKHCPGDEQAKERAKSTNLSPGETVVFKGGVHYRGTVGVPFSGAPGKPITYDGNSAGKFGAGKAIIQGGEPVGGWKKVVSAGEVSGNPNWNKLYCTLVDARHTFFNFSLYQGANYLNCAQDPNPEDPFYHDQLETYLPKEAGQVKVTATSITDAAYFTQADKGYFDGAYAAVWVRPSVIVYKRIRAYDPVTHSVTFDKITNELYQNSRAKYSLLNSLKFLDRPGEYYLDEKSAKDGKVRLVLWPPEAGTNGLENVTISERLYGFDLRGASHVTIDGFQIYQQGGDRAAGIFKSSAGKTTGLVIRNNEIARVRTYPNRSAAIRMGEVEHSTIERNHIHENAYCAGLMLTQFNDSVAQYNLLRKNGSTAVDYYNCHRSKLLGNIIRDNLGMHANGLTLYVGCTDILVEGNEVYNANGVTTNDGDRIVIRNNIFDGAGKNCCMGLWKSGPMTHLTIVNNLIIRSSGWGIYFGNTGGNWIIKNNIIDGLAGEIPPDTQFGNNIYTRTGEATHKLEEGEKVVEDLQQLFVDPEHLDFHSKPGSPALDAGADVSAYYPKQAFPDYDFGLDKDGKPRVTGKAMDIGAYEFAPGK